MPLFANRAVAGGSRPRPVVVVCLDGSAFEYIDRAIAAGVAPYLRSLATANDTCAR